MKQQVALDHLEKMRQAIQRFRSNYLGGRDAAAEMPVLIMVNKWLWDDRYCPLTSLVEVIDRGHVNGMEFYNFMIALHRFMPEVQACADHTWPEPNMSLIFEVEE